jgi:hypothetical protein
VEEKQRRAQRVRSAKASYGFQCVTYIAQTVVDGLDVLVMSGDAGGSRRTEEGGGEGLDKHVGYTQKKKSPKRK